MSHFSFPKMLDMPTLAATRSPLLLSISLILSMIPNSKSYLYHFCSNDTSFATKSKYETNLNSLFRSLSSNATASNNSGFYATASANGTRDAVFGLFLCRGDQNSTTCGDCVALATGSDLPKTYCANRKVAVIWYDECMVRYSNQSFFGKMDQAPKVFLTNTQNINGNKTQFTDLLGKTMNDVAVRASSGDKSGRKFATEKTSFTSLEPLYALAQCTPDLTSSDCNTCLRIAIGQLSIMQGARVLQPSCNVRYETYPFYNGETADSPAPSPSPTTNTTSSPSPVAGNRKRKVSAKVIIAIVAPVVVISVVVLALRICLIKRKRKKYDAVALDQNVGEDFTNAESLQYDLATLQSATNNFSDENKLGEGGFGSVYKGVLTNGNEIAVKRLSASSSQGVVEFKNEMLLVAKLQHRNLVRLLGFCIAGQEKLLVYEYVHNKSLDYFLFDPEKHGQLDWGRRYKIIQGIARGMLYLHQDSRLRIIHRDLKASNILLDDDMIPKISDFGMARIVEQSQGNTSRVVGTYGYMSPEYAMHGQFSVKSDVYSFGVLILEIISGKRNSSFFESGYAEDLFSYAWKMWRDGMPLAFVDPTIKDSCTSNEVIRCIHLGLLCVQESIDERPTMGTVVLMLDSHTVTLPVPEQPAFFIKSKTASSLLKDIESDKSTSKSNPLSVNDVSVTEIEPR